MGFVGFGPKYDTERKADRRRTNALKTDLISRNRMKLIIAALGKHSKRTGRLIIFSDMQLHEIVFLVAKKMRWRSALYMKRGKKVRAASLYIKEHAREGHTTFIPRFNIDRGLWRTITRQERSGLMSATLEVCKVLKLI